MKTTRMLAILVLALGLTTEVANADFTFGTPTNLGPIVNSSSNDDGPCSSADGLSLFFDSHRPGGDAAGDIWVSIRETTSEPWGEPVNLGPTVNSSFRDWEPSISADSLTLYFQSDRPGGYGNVDIWVATRETTGEDWATPVNLGPKVNSSAHDSNPSISADGLSFFFESNRGGYDVWVMTRETKDDPWGTPVNLGPIVNSSSGDGGPGISADGLTLFFHSNRPGRVGGLDIWVTTRASVSDPWGTPVNLGSTVNTNYGECSPSISADGMWLYFCDYPSPRPGGHGGEDLWQAPILPVVDFNGDGIVDSADMCIMVDRWHTDEPLCDIGPMPWGDGIVDVQDLIVLAEYLFTDLRLVAHWKLDETEGSVAYDDARNNDGILNGEPLWQPTGGQVDGALAFDGIDDYVSTLFILNPAEGPFSVFTWIKGGAPGQVIISQTGGANWLSADPSDGKLMTSLSRPAGGRSAPQPLISEFIITDGQWHRVGLVWDGSDRILYADDVEVATDTQAGLGSSEGGLYIGAGKAMEPGTYWSGLIDDVRIYDRAITP